LLLAHAQMNRLVATLAVASTLSVAAPPAQCDQVDLGLKDGALKGDSNADYFLVAMLYAW